MNGWLRDVAYGWSWREVIRTRRLRWWRLRGGEVSRDVIEDALREMADGATSGNTRTAALGALETVRSRRRTVIR